jgi:hypothetical protein
MLYLWLKVVHVVAVIVWSGGALTLMTATARLLRSGDRKILAGFLTFADFYGPVVGIGSLLVLLSGLAMAGAGHLFRAPWVQAGIGGFVVLSVIGGAFTRRAAGAFRGVLADPASDETTLVAAGRRLGRWNAAYLLLLLMMIMMMILKPAGS